MLKRFGRILVFLALGGVITACIFFSEKLTEGVLSGIRICMQSLIPSLYFFMVLSNLILGTRLRSILGAPFSLLAKRIFRLDAPLFTIFLLSCLGGYPVGAKLIADSIRKGEISPAAGQYMMDFCCNCSPAFLISFLSVQLWDSIEIGLVLFLAQLLSCTVIAFISGRKQSCIRTVCPAKQQSPPLSVTLVGAVNNATKTMAVICSFVVVFCAAFPFVDLLPVDGLVKIYLKGLLEVTSGSRMVSVLGAYPGIIAAALFTSFGGICVFLQVFALLSGTGVRFWRWFSVRTVYTLLCTGFTYLGLRILRPAVTCAFQLNGFVLEPYTSSPVAAIGLLILCSMLLLFSVGRNTIRLSRRGK